jgi:hypothetical protein
MKDSDRQSICTVNKRLCYNKKENSKFLMYSAVSSYHLFNSTKKSVLHTPSSTEINLINFFK